MGPMHMNISLIIDPFTARQVDHYVAPQNGSTSAYISDKAKGHRKKSLENRRLRILSQSKKFKYTLQNWESCVIRDAISNLYIFLTLLMPFRLAKSEYLSISHFTKRKTVSMSIFSWICLEYTLG